MLVQKHTFGRGHGKVAQWPRGRSYAGLLTALEAHSQRRRLVLVYNLCPSNSSEMRRPTMNMTLRELLLQSSSLFCNIEERAESAGTVAPGDHHTEHYI